MSSLYKFGEGHITSNTHGEMENGEIIQIIDYITQKGNIIVKINHTVSEDKQALPSARNMGMRNYKGFKK